MHATLLMTAAALASTALAGPVAGKKHHKFASSASSSASAGAASPTGSVATAAGNGTTTSSSSGSSSSGTAPGAVGAVPTTTQGAGPNGAESWFNTGIDGSGWTPPYLNFSSIVHVSTQTFYAGAGSACKQYDQYFEASGPKYNIDPAILAAIAMQESSCNAYPGNSDNGTPGLMQVACSNYPSGSCSGQTVASNVDAGASYLRSQLDQYNDNALEALGAYNGWFTAGSDSPDNGQGLTAGYPCSAAGKANGEPQNLDYLQQTLNGWFQGYNVYGNNPEIGTYQCQGTCNGNNQC